MKPKEINKKPIWKILVVDDEPLVSETIQRLLEIDGHVVQTANSSRQALGLLEQEKFDLITTDFSMSKIKGETLAVAVKERRPNQPVLMISTNGVIAKASGDALPGVDMVISKPFSQKELRDAVAEILTRI